MSAFTNVVFRGTQATIGLGAIMDVLINGLATRTFTRQNRNIDRFDRYFLFNAFFQDRFTLLKGIIRYFMGICRANYLMRR